MAVLKQPNSRFVEPVGFTNRILFALPPASLDRMKPFLEPLIMEKGQVIDRANGPIRHMYFVNRGLVSVVKTMRDGRTVEIGAVGIEGVTDPNALFGIDHALLETMVQIPGSAFRIEREILMREMAKDNAVREIMQKYVRFAFSQLAQTAACNRLHSLEERCCRWLLLAHDSALADNFSLTHEFLAMMLGVRRTGVSIVAHLLKKAGMIDYKRGRVTILDRAALADAACECYGSTQAQLEELFGGCQKHHAHRP
jgi:CRP-like cAMP-binding protein